MWRWPALVAMFVVGIALGVTSLQCARLARVEDASPAATGATSQNAHSQPAAGTHESLDAAAVHEELQALRRDVARWRSSPGHLADVSQEARIEAPRQASDAARRHSTSAATADGQRTLAYWNQLNAIMAQETAMRGSAADVTAENAPSLVAARREAFQFAAQAIRQLDPEGADPEVVAIAYDIAQWYDEGTANSQEAESLLGTADVATRRGPRGSSWRTNEQRHRDRCLEINRHGAELQRKMSEKYQLAFPKLL